MCTPTATILRSGQVPSPTAREVARSGSAGSRIALWFEADLDMFIEDGDATVDELRRRQVINVVHAYCRAQDEVADPLLDAWRSGDAILARLDRVTRWTRMRKVTLDEVERLLTDDEIEKTLDVAMAVTQYSDEWIDERPSILDDRAWSGLQERDVPQGSGRRPHPRLALRRGEARRPPLRVWRIAFSGRREPKKPTADYPGTSASATTTPSTRLFRIPGIEAFSSSTVRSGAIASGSGVATACSSTLMHNEQIITIIGVFPRGSGYRRR